MEWIKQMKAWNLKRKITFFITLAMFVTSVVIMLISTISAVYYMTSQSKDMAKTQLRILSYNYDDALEQYQNLTVALVIEDSVQKYCKSQVNAGTEYEMEAGNVYNFLLSMLNVRSNLNFAVIQKEASSRYVYKGNTSINDAKFDVVYQADYEKSLPAKEKSTVRMSFGNRYFRDGKYTLTLYHPIYSTSSIHEVIGMLVMNFNDSFIEQLHQEESRKMDSELFLVDCNGKIVSISNGERIGTEVSYADRMTGNCGSFQEAGKLINYQKVGKWNYYLISEIPVLELYKSSIAAMALMVFVTFAMTVVAIVILRRLLHSFYEPINQVVMAMDDVAEGKLDERIDIKSMDADSQKLKEGFNSMMDEIDTLMEQVKMEQHQMEQIRFNALQAQIKPHFLYNTLECIHWQAVVDGNKEISVMVKAMAQYYRVCLSKGKEVIELRQELEHIRSYLIIQNMRYDNIIDLEDNIPKKYYDVKIPKMTLQPLIENAVYHGIRIKEGGRGKIALGIRSGNGDVYLLVEDSGTGMTQEEIDEINQSVSRHDEAFGYGVRNVNRRIELMFGVGYGLHYFRNKNGGVTVEIHLPLNGKIEDKGVI